MEIDGASHTGVDDVRGLQETLHYVPQRSKFKVYIIDEVHMLSQSAFNALLKTLEETPKHVVFILATTDLHRIPNTIASRCPVYHLKKMTVDTIFKRMQEILRLESIPYADEALRLIAREGRGSMRDALTLLDQAIALGSGDISKEAVSRLVGGDTSSVHFRLLNALIELSAAKALAEIEILENAGCDYAVLAEQLAKLTRHIFIIKTIGKDALDISMLGLDSNEIDVLQDLATKTENTALNRLFRHLAQSRSELNGSTLDRFVFENICFEWCLGQLDLPQDRDNSPRSTNPGFVKPAPRQVAPTSNAITSAKLDPIPTENVELSKSQLPTPAAPAAPADATDAAPNTPVVRPIPSGDRLKQLAGELASGKEFKQSEVSKKGSAPEGTMPKIEATQPIAKNQSMSFPKPPDLEITDPTMAVKASPSEAATKAIDGSASREINTPAPPMGTFPETWSDLVDLWKSKKPLQARKLEEVHCLEYSPSTIKVLVDSKSLAANSLLDPAQAAKIQDQFQELFQFSGRFIVTQNQGAISGDPSNPTGASAPRPESILERKDRENLERTNQIIENARKNELTVTALAATNGQIASIQVKDKP